MVWCDDPENAAVSPTDADGAANRWGETRAPATLRQWLLSGAAFGREVDEPLTEASADKLNRAAQAMYDGSAECVTKTGPAAPKLETQDLTRLLRTRNLTIDEFTKISNLSDTINVILDNFVFMRIHPIKVFNPDSDNVDTQHDSC